MKPSSARPPDSPVGAPSASPSALPAADLVEAPAAASPARPSALGAANGAVPVPSTPATPGQTRARPHMSACPSWPPGLRLRYDPNGREWRISSHPAGAAAAASGGGGAATLPASAGGAGPAPDPGGGPAVVSEARQPLLGQAAPALPPRPSSPAVLAWLAPLIPVVVATDWLLVSNVSLSTNPQDANRTHAVWRAFLEFAEAAGYDARPSAERDFGFLIRSVGGSAAWLRCMLQYAYLEDWHTLRRHRPAVPFGHSFELVNFGGVGPLLALSPVVPPSTPVDLALEAARRSRGELVSTRRAGHGAIFLPVRTGIGLAPAPAPLPPAMATRYAKPRLLK